MSRKIVLSNVSNLVALYQSGISEKELANKWGVDRQVIKRTLLESGVKRRTQSEAETVKWMKMPTAKRIAQTKAANLAVRGSKHTKAQKIIHAQGVQRVGKMNTAETFLFEALQEIGLHPIPQFALGIYNLDLALDTSGIAIEIFGGGFHSYGNHATRHFKRCKYILDQGWSLMIIWVDALYHPLGIGVRNDVIAFIQQTSGYPSSSRKYRMVWGDSNPVPALGRYFNDDAFIKRLCATR